MTVVPEQRDDWREEIAKRLQDTQQQGEDWQDEIDFFSAVLAILNSHIPILDNDHPYAQAVAVIQASIPSEGLPFDTQLISQSIAALSGPLQEKAKHIQYLAALERETTDQELKVIDQRNTIGIAWGGSLTAWPRFEWRVSIGMEHYH